MMPPRFAAVVVAVTMVALMSGAVTVGDSNWSERCKGQVCTVAEKQAEGLARLRVLSNYIRETMSLMESVVSSLDDEMLVVGRELGSAVGRRCHARGPSALTALITHINHTEAYVNEEGIVEVISDDTDDYQASSSDLTQGSTTTWSGDVDVLMGSSSSAAHSTSHRPGSTSHSTYHGISQRPSSATYSTSQGISQYPSSTSHSTSRHPSTVSQISSSSSTTHSSSIDSHTTGKTLHRRPSNTPKKYEAQSGAASESLYVAPAQPEDTNRQRGGGHKQGLGRGHKQGLGRGHGQGRGNARVRDQDGGRGQGASGSLGSDSFHLCRGVPIGSLHYVPGLDAWCANNCPRMCPATHCICSTP